MQNDIKIAITGGICCGKSTVAQIIREQGYKVLSCDEIYKELLNNIDFVNLIDSEFNGVKNNDGTLNRDKLSEIVFADNEKLKKLNSITHPQIMQRAMEQMSGNGIFFCEVPLLFEGQFEGLFDNVIVVLRDENERLRELMQRSKIGEIRAKKRINSQFDYKNCDFTKYYVIHNDTSLADLRKNTLEALSKIIEDYN